PPPIGRARRPSGSRSASSSASGRAFVGCGDPRSWRAFHPNCAATIPDRLGMNEGPAIEVRHLVKRYGAVTAVEDLTFAVPPGSITALLGGNGAGKTTTLAILLGVLLPTAGEARVLGVDILKHRYRVLPRMNFGSPYVELPKRLTVRENLTVFAQLYGVRHPR